MLVILMEDHIVSPKQVCQSCLLANRSGEPRWQRGKLRCGHAVRNLLEGQPDQFECEMGFRVAEIK